MMEFSENTLESTLDMQEIEMNDRTEFGLSKSNMKKGKLMAEFTQYEMPVKIEHAKFIAACESEVEVNGYELDIKNMPETIYKYHIDLISITEKRRRDLSKGQKQDYAVQMRRRVCFSLYCDLLKKYADLVSDKYSVIYDAGNTLYSRDKLPLFGTTFELFSNDISSENSKYYLGRDFVKVEIVIQFTNDVHITLIGKPEVVRETQQFFEVLTTINIIKNADHVVFGNKVYVKSSRDDVPIGQAKVVKNGVEKNCRVIEADGKPMLMLQIGAKKSPFFSDISVVKFCKEFLNCREYSDLEHAFNNRRLATQVAKQLKDLAVCTTHTEPQRQFYIHGLNTKNAKETTFTLNDEVISVYDFFRDKYKMTLKYPLLPVCIERKPSSISYHPMECLIIGRGQRVTTEKQTSQISEKMIRECQLRPLDMKNHIENQMYKASLDVKSVNKYLRAFRVRVGVKPLRAPARRLFPPAIKYGSNVVEPSRNGDLMWKLTGREQFEKPARLEKKWIFVIFDYCIDGRVAQHFVQSLARCGNDHGMKMDDRMVEFKNMSSELDDSIEEFIRGIAKSTSIIMFTTKMKMDPVHDTMKSMEARYGVVTQHISQQTLMKAISGQGQFMVLGNLILKTNLKLGGINHILTMSRVFHAANNNMHHYNEILFPRSRMFVGFDVSHAGPQSFADRQLKIPQSEPSVVGMAFSLSTPTQIRGMYWMQEAKSATISEIRRYFPVALEMFHKTNGSLPKDVVVFRGGVSEGEFNKVIEEMEDLRKSFSMVASLSTKKYKPALTCIVVQTNSNFRVVPTRIDSRARPMDQNVPAGTLVDEQIVHPALNEFLLIPQKALQGTARPIRCTVVVHESGHKGALSMDDIQQITNALCYGHQVVCGSTSVPLVCYAATNLTKRGRNNWKVDNFRNSDSMTEMSGNSGDRGKWRHDGSEDFFVKMSDALQSNVNTHYWA